MKKITVLLLCLMIPVLSACGTQQPAEQPATQETQQPVEQPSEQSNEISELFDKGFTPSMTSSDESFWAGVFQFNGEWDSVYIVRATINAEQYEMLSALDFCDDDYSSQLKAILCEISDFTVTDVTSLVPSQEELDSYIGITMGELEQEGFEKTGYSGSPESGYMFYYDGPDYNLYVHPDDSVVIDDIDDFSENDLRALQIGSVEFAGFSFSILE